MLADNVARARFEVLSLVGRGFGTVFLVQEVSSGRELAMRIVGREYVERGLCTMLVEQHALRHPAYVRLHELFYTSGATEDLVLITDYCNTGSTLWELLQRETRLTEDRARSFLQQLALLAHYHTLTGDPTTPGVDFKHIYLHQEPDALHPTLKIHELRYRRTLGYTFCQSARELSLFPPAASFHAPEVLADYFASPSFTGSGLGATPSAQVWACGAALFTMLYGRYPFDPEEDDETFWGELETSQQPSHRHFLDLQILAYKKIILNMEAEACQLDPAAQVSPECLTLLRAMLKPKPCERISLAALLAHPWFLSCLPPGAVQDTEQLAAAAATEAPKRQTQAQLKELLHEAMTADDMEAKSRARWNMER